MGGILRRSFLGALPGVAIAGVACRRRSPDPTLSTPDGTIAGESVERGHRLRGASPIPSPTVTARAKVIIVGAGVAGLSAAWRLREAGVESVTVLELATSAGGTARSGRTTSSAFPWGAHYLPVPNPETAITLRFLEQVGLCTGAASGRPRFAERHLVFAPEDRLFFRGGWYDGLYLRAGASPGDLAELGRFEELCATYRRARGKDGLLAFAIPTAFSSRDPVWTGLDAIPLARWLAENAFRSPRLHWMIDYACRDDYGAGIADVSAWAGLHYFCGRRGIDTPETRGTHYFTWPEGNGWLVERLLELSQATVQTDQIVLAVAPSGRVVSAHAERPEVTELQADAVILATPSHVAGHLLGRRPFATHAPWLVANLSLLERPERHTGAWNNALYDSPGLGYIDSTHQQPETSTSPVYSYYRALPRSERGWLLASGFDTLSGAVLDDLRRAHPDLRQCLGRIDLWRWGHGTLVPAPGVQFDGTREAFSAPAGVVELAHTDLSGLPFFEEAQYRGVLAAERVLDRLGVGGDRWSRHSGA